MDDKIDVLIDRLDRLIALLSSRAAPVPRQDITQSFMSGRWRRRDGDVYGIDVQPGDVGLPTAEDVKGILNADSAPGDIRPPDQR